MGSRNCFESEYQSHCHSQSRRASNDCQHRFLEPIAHRSYPRRPQFVVIFYFPAAEPSISLPAGCIDHSRWRIWLKVVRPPARQPAINDGAHGHRCEGAGQAKAQSRKPRSPARGNGAVQKARIIVPVTRATIVLIEVGSCARTLWTRPKPTTSVTQLSASITTFRCVRRLAASSEKLFINMLPEDVPVVSRSPGLGRC